MSAGKLAAVLSLAAGLGGCGGTEPAPATPATKAAEAPPPKVEAEPAPAAKSPPVGPAAVATPKADVPPPGSSTQRRMHAHFAHALSIRKAVIAGTPERAADPAEALAKTEKLDEVPASWRAAVQRMQEIAGRINNSTSAAQAAGATADLAVACGGCHQTQGGPKTSSEPPPPEAGGLTERMQRHAWATERLWEGLTVPSSEAWNAGAKALNASPFPAEVLKQGGVHGRSAASDFAKLVLKAPTKKTIEERAGLYAELLVTCGGCHRAINEAGTK
jgi:hypothetical protein